MIRLQVDKIINSIDPKYSKTLLKEYFVIFNSIESTNSYLLKNAKFTNNHLMFCLAEQQTKGRGRIDRTWHSPAGNIYLSILTTFNLKLQQLRGLNIAIALAVIRALNKYGVINLYLKWPNDILYHDAKLGGILIETIAGSRYIKAVIGIGINTVPDPEFLSVNSTTYNKQNLQNIMQKTPDRNVLIGKIISEILATLNIFSTRLLDRKFIIEWQKYSYNLNRLINVKIGDQIIQGINKGIDHQGNLLLEIENSNNKLTNKIITLRTISSGEIKHLN